ncbi:MAG: hypothetical protein IJ064_00620 [Bacteroidaceae bacterium]|nr:hypothetical protein [Bacteroidaceae bacterium]
MTRRISLLCVIYFVVFSFLFLYVLERDVLAQTQFQLSEGSTVQHPLMAALLPTFLFTLLGLFLGHLLGWLPLRFRAMAWCGPLLLTGLLCHWCFPMVGTSLSSYFWSGVILIIALYLGGLLLCRNFPDSLRHLSTFSSYAWPNILLLLLFTLFSVLLANTDSVTLRTLAASRYVRLHQYGRALHQARWERHPSYQLSAATALSLSETGQLGERLFAYPQPWGSEGLLPQMSDTLLVNDLPGHVALHLGYCRGSHVSATSFLATIYDMPKSRPAVRDYLLCAYLLNRDLEGFVRVLNDTCYSVDSLPRHYREALVLRHHLRPLQAPAIDDASLNLRFAVFQHLLHESGTKAEREYKLRERFGANYWTYYYFPG